jgi:hypothetical protein
MGPYEANRVTGVLDRNTKYIFEIANGFSTKDERRRYGATTGSM